MDLLLVTKNKGQRKGAGGEEKVLKITSGGESYEGYSKEGEKR